MLPQLWGSTAEGMPLATSMSTTEVDANPFRNAPTDVSRLCKNKSLPEAEILWIDSLCIIQDDEGDWAKEAALMASVYSHSYFTLAALDSKDSSAGCNMVADIQTSYSNRFTDIDFYGLGKDESSFHHQRLRFFEFLFFDDGSIEAEHLNSRAWTLQERELSRRVISFSSQALLWECSELRTTSQRPWENIDRYITLLSAETAFTKGLFKSNTSWDDIVEDYSARSLTKQTDKLIALSGIAQAAQEFYQGATYVGGLWSSLIPEVLL